MDYFNALLNKLDDLGLLLVNVLDAVQRNPTPAYLAVICYLGYLARQVIK